MCNNGGGGRHPQVQRRPGSCKKSAPADVQRVLNVEKELVQVDKPAVERAEEQEKMSEKGVADDVARSSRMPTV